MDNNRCKNTDTSIDIRNKNDIKSKGETDSYEKLREVIDSILVDLFKNILKIEKKSLRARGIKDLTITEIHAINAVGTGDGKSMTEIAEALDITMGTLTTTITKLEKKGYVNRVKDRDDRRVVITSLTKTGRWVEKIYRNFHDEMIDHLIIDLKLDENQNLIQALSNINEFFLREYGG